MGRAEPIATSGLDVYVDEACPMCVSLADRLDRLDPILPIRRLPIGGAERFEHSALVSELHVVDGRGRVHRGYDGVIALIAATRRAGWIAPVLRTPPVRWVGRRIYRIVAGHRRRRD